MKRKKYSLKQLFHDAEEIITASNFCIENGTLIVKSAIQRTDNEDFKFRFIIHYTNDPEYNLDDELRESIFCSGNTPEKLLIEFKGDILKKLGIKPEPIIEESFESDIELPF